MMRHRFCQYFALGFLLAAQSALAVETAAVITNTSTAVDAGMASLGGAKWFKARDYSSVVGNNALRNAAANRANATLRSIKGMSEKFKLPLLSTTVQVSDTGGTVLGALSAGDVSGAGSELLNTGVSTLSVTAGAAVGGKLFASAGALVGSAVPVVGTAAGAVVGGVVGSVVGSVGGAVLTSMGYDAYLKEWVRNTAEGAMTAKVDYVALAKESRESFEQQQQENANRARSEEEKNQAASRFGYDKSTGYSDAGEVQLSPSTPTLDSLPANSSAGTGIPLFPSNATISAVAWVGGGQELEVKSNQTLFLKEGAVLGQMTMGIDAQDCKVRIEGSYAGTIRDNVMKGVWSMKSTTRCAPTSSGCTVSGTSRIESQEEVVFDLGGKLSGRVTGGSHNDQGAVTGCKDATTYSTSGKVDPMPINGTWKLLK